MASQLGRVMGSHEDGAWGAPSSIMLRGPTGSGPESHSTCRAGLYSEVDASFLRGDICGVLSDHSGKVYARLAAVLSDAHDGVSVISDLQGRFMTITVDITPEVEAELARQAAARGRAVEAYAAILLEEAVRLPTGAGRLRQDRLENTLREMAQFSHKIPALPDEAFTREDLYRDHD